MTQTAYGAFPSHLRSLTPRTEPACARRSCGTDRLERFQINKSIRCQFFGGIYSTLCASPEDKKNKLSFKSALKLRFKKSNKSLAYPKRVKHPELLVKFFMDTDPLPPSHYLLSSGLCLTLVREKHSSLVKVSI